MERTVSDHALSGLRIEVEAGFDAAELRRLVAALDDTQWWPAHK